MFNLGHSVTPTHHLMLSSALPAKKQKPRKDNLRMTKKEEFGSLTNLSYTKRVFVTGPHFPWLIWLTFYMNILTCPQNFKYAHWPSKVGGHITTYGVHSPASGP